MAWLSGWKKRIPITAETTVISGGLSNDLSDFPILISLSESSGINNTDMTYVFDRLTSSIIAEEVFYVTTGPDDGWGYPSSPDYFNNGGNLARLGVYWGSSDKAFIRFQNLDIPSLATIHEAYIRLTAYDDGTASTDDVKLKIFGNDVDDSTAPSSYDELHSLTQTTAYSTWETGNWSNGTQYSTSDLSSVIQEIINRSGWSSGNSIQFKLKNDTGSGNYVNFSTYDYSSGAEKPELHVKWSEPVYFSKKVAITAPDGTTQYPVEIDKWDGTAEEAYLWTKIPTLVSGSETKFYLYYNSELEDNGEYVGDVGSLVGRSVWANNFTSVWHLNDSTSGNVKSSVSGTLDGTVSGTPSSVPGKIGNALQFDSTSDYIDFGNSSEIDFGEDGDSYTVEALIKTTVSGQKLLYKGDSGAYPLAIEIDDFGAAKFSVAALSTTSFVKVNDETMDHSETTSDAGDADNCSDNNVNTSWDPAWNSTWWVDLGDGNPQEVVRVTYKNNSFTDRCISDFRVQGSNDNSSWDTLLDDSFSKTNDSQTKSFSTTGSYRYYRLIIDSYYYSGSGLVSAATIHLEKPLAYVESVTSSGTINDGEYHYVVGVRDDDLLRIYVDGEKTSFSGTIGDASSDSSLILTGNSATIDEIRLSDAVKSDDWIKASYYNKNDNLLSFGELEGKWSNSFNYNSKEGRVLKGTSNNFVAVMPEGESTFMNPKFACVSYGSGAGLNIVSADDPTNFWPATVSGSDNTIKEDPSDLTSVR